MRYTIRMFAAAVPFLLLPAAVFAYKHAPCCKCGQLITVNKSKVGTYRGTGRRFVCGKCTRAYFQPRPGKSHLDVIERHAFKNPNWEDYRYPVFSDGTLLDMGHVFAAADVASYVGPSISFYWGGLVEWQQCVMEFIGGSKVKSSWFLTGNEDIYSNLAGVLYGTGSRLGVHSAEMDLVTTLETGTAADVVYATNEKPDRAVNPKRK